MEAKEQTTLLNKRGIGCSVTQRIKNIKQPKGGYIKPKELIEFSLGEGIEMLNSNENIHPILVGLAVDYLTRFLSGTSLNEAFVVSFVGARMAGKWLKAYFLKRRIKGLSNSSIISAVKLAGFDVVFRAGIRGYKPVEDINPDKETIENIRVMVERSLNFLQKHGPKVLDGFYFEGGYTDIVSFGDGDFITKDTLWDFKVSKNPIKSQHTLQLLMYWRMGLHSIHKEFKKVKYLGIYNPRTNAIFRIKTSEISTEIINEVEKEVIGYK